MSRPLPVLAAVWIALAPAAVAAPWEFGEAVVVSGDREGRRFHHLDASGRQHLAAGADRVALVWEDDRSGAPQVYLALKPRTAPGFTREFRLSEGEEAFEPVVVALGEGRFLAAWEQDGSVWGSVVDREGPGPRVRIAARARQVSLAAERPGAVAAVWAAERGRGQLLQATTLDIAASGPRPGRVVEVAAPDDRPFQAFPSALFAPGGTLVVAWEDRRAGHTRLFHTRRDAHGTFEPARQLNEHNAPRGEAGEISGLGSGVMRVALARDDRRIIAVWLDKRNPESGYAVWGAVSKDGGARFDTNHPVQDEMGSAVPQWHAAVAAGAGLTAAVWDDTREAWDDESETGDVLMSWFTPGGWSEDLLVPGASGAGYQGSPVLAVDPVGDLHMAWIDRPDLDSPTRLLYLHARRLP